MGSEKFLFRLEQPHGLGNVFIAWQKGSSNYLATTGVDSVVNIFNRYGQIQERIKLAGLCSGFEWDSDGDLLAIVSQSSQLIIWDSNVRKKSCIELNLRDTMTCLFWTKRSQILAIGSVKGNVCIYDHTTSKRTPVIGKHSKKITCGAWNVDNVLALGSEDKTLSLSNIEGDTIKIISLRAEPSNIQFSEMKVDERMGGENTVSLIVGKKTLYLYNLFDPENPIELAFQQHYGNLVTYKWFGDGYILLGFSFGFFIAISTHIKEVGQELFQIKDHKNALNDIALCKTIGKVASCGDNIIKIHDMNNLQETSSVLTLSHETSLEQVMWSDDGQLLAVCTVNGSVNVYVSYIPMLTSVCGSRIAVLSNLSEVSLYNYCDDKTKLIPIPIPLETEPTFIAVGPYHFLAGINNKAWLYDLTRPQPTLDDVPLLLRSRQYLFSITSVRINSEYISVLFEGKIQLHMIEQPAIEYEDRESRMFPDANEENQKITCHALTTDFLIYGTNEGQMKYFYIEDWTFSNSYTHTVGISDIFVDPAGTRLVFIDTKNQGFVYNAVNGEVIPVPNLPQKVKGAIWDSSLSDKNVFVIYDDHNIYTYIFLKFSTDGALVQSLDKTSLASNQIPLLMYSGEIILATANGNLTTIFLDVNDSNLKQSDKIEVEANFKRHLNLHRFSSALKICTLLGSREMWKQLADKSLRCLDVNVAIHAYKELGDIAMVSALEKILDVQDLKLLAGYCCMFLKDYSKAQKWFLGSQFPQAALEMRRDLLQWDQALELSKKMAPEQVPFISREYAQQLEFMGNNSEAYIHYEKGLLDNDPNTEHTFLCKCGTARTAIKCGNYKQGMIIANEVNDKQLYLECAESLEAMRQLADAATFFEKARVYDRAASAYIKVKNWKKVEELLPNVTSNKIQLQFAKAKESEGKYEDAVKAYYMAKDFDSVIRLELDYLNNPTAAVELAQETKSLEGYKLIARFFQRVNDYSSAIKFLILSLSFDEAYELARKQKMLAVYGDTLLNTLTLEEIRVQDFNSLAVHFEQEKNNLLAGKYYFHAKEYAKAMELLLKASKSNIDENEAISLAIDVAASSNDNKMAAQLIEFLLGEADGIPKDPKYLFRLYMARKQFRDAAKSAMIIANEEQVNGNYRNARDILFNMYQELKANGINIPHEMYFNLMLLHSYILVRLHVKRGDHVKAARLLIRVAENISKFPSHIIPILTSTVIECHRADLRHAAYKYAANLVQNPNYRKEIDGKYVRKIESIVRKAPKNGISGDSVNDPIEPTTPCPYCEELLPETITVCSNCKSNIPICIVTGHHIVKDDLTVCSECNFPAIRSKLLEILDTEDTCPMCTEKINRGKLSLVQFQELVVQK